MKTNFTLYVCDSCKAQVKTSDSANAVPVNLFHLTVPWSTTRGQDFDFCSLECLLKFIKDHSRGL